MNVLAAIIHFVIEPLHILLALIIGLMIASGIMNRQKRGRWVGIFGTLTLLWAGNLVLPVVPYFMVQALENRFPQGEAENLDRIIILGGWQGDGLIQSTRGQPVYSGSSGRLAFGLELARRHPRAEVIFPGGLNRYEDGASEDEITAAVLAQWGLDDARFRIEGQSVNTAENAAETAAMIAIDARIALVTSAAHMPRSMAVFRANGMDPVAFPTDYQTTGSMPPLKYFYRKGLGLTRIALREWVGLVAYRLLGRTDTLLPKA